MRDSWPSAVARRIGLGGEINFTPARVGQTLHIPCKGKGRHRPHVVDVPIAPGLHPDGVAKKLLHEGWTIGHRLMCPNTRAKREERAVADQPTKEPEVEAPAPTPAAGRARRLVYMALEDYYDEGRKSYKPGHSDESIAKDCNVSEQLVRSIREESYGPLAVPCELAAFEAKIAAFRDTAKAHFEAHEQAAQELERQLAQLVRKNGWQR